MERILVLNINVNTWVVKSKFSNISGDVSLDANILFLKNRQNRELLHLKHKRIFNNIIFYSKYV